MDIEVLDDDDDVCILIDVDEEEEAKASAKFNFLNDAFPEADKEFLRAKCVEYAWDETAFATFLERMVSNDFPKVADDRNDTNKKSVSEERGEFNLDGFLKKYPDPVKYFSEKLHAVFYTNHSAKFLLARYRYVRADIIKAVLKRNQYRLYTTFKELESIPNSRINSRLDWELPTVLGQPPNEFLDEVDFISNEYEINTYLADLTLARNHAVEEARKANALLTCGCCMADEMLTYEVESCSEGHVFCRSCILTSSNIRIGDGKTDFPCLQECTGSFTLNTLKKILPENTYEHLLKRIQAKEVAAANIPGLETCSFCSYSAIPPEDSTIFNCDYCNTQMCRSCRRKAHIPFKCSEVKDDNTVQRLFVEETMTEALLRKCWQCGTQFLREDGCNKMVCICGAKMCYICRQPIKGYNHFSQNDRSAGQSNKCPLWTSNREAHDKAVAREGKRAIEELKRKHPEMKLELFSKKKR